ncbi:MAG: GNAT family N-acetyltransferase [Malacoplasma sp.]
MSLRIIKTEHSEEWDNIVQSFKKYDVYYLSGYVKAFQLHGDGEPLLFYFENDSTRAINVVMKRDIADSAKFKDKIPQKMYFDFSTPYGYGGFLVEGEDFKQIELEYTQYCKKNNIVSEFVRCHPVLNNVEKLKGIFDVKQLGSTVCMDLSSQETIWNNCTSKGRNMVRKAQKSGMEVYWGRDDFLIDEFINIYNRTMDRDIADSYYYFQREFYESILKDLNSNAMFFYVRFKDEIIAMSIVMFCNCQMHYHLSASKKEYLNYAPTNLLLYEAACYGCDHGYQSFHLGGGLGAKQDSLYKFKKAFSRGEDKEFYIGKKIFLQESYDNLVEIRKSEEEYKEENLFFPRYRG